MKRDWMEWVTSSATAIVNKRYERASSKKTLGEREQRLLDWYAYAYPKAGFLVPDHCVADAAVIDSIRLIGDIEILRATRFNQKQKDNLQAVPLPQVRSGAKISAMRKPAGYYPVPILAERALLDACDPYERERRDKKLATKLEGLGSVVAAVVKRSLKDDRHTTWNGGIVLATGVLSVVFEYRIGGRKDEDAREIWWKIVDGTPLVHAKESRNPENEQFASIFLDQIQAVMARLNSAVSRDDVTGVRRETGGEVELRHVDRALATLGPGSLALCGAMKSPPGAIEKQANIDLLRGHRAACGDCRRPIVAAVGASQRPEKRIVEIKDLKEPIEPNSGDRHIFATPSSSDLEPVRAQLRQIAREKGTALPYPLAIEVDGAPRETAGATINRKGTVTITVSAEAERIDVWAPDAQGTGRVLLVGMPLMLTPGKAVFALPGHQHIEIEISPIELSDGVREVDVQLTYTEQDWVRRLVLHAMRWSETLASLRAEVNNRPAFAFTSAVLATAVLAIVVGLMFSMVRDRSQQGVPGDKKPVEYTQSTGKPVEPADDPTPTISQQGTNTNRTESGTVPNPNTEQAHGARPMPAEILLASASVTNGTPLDAVAPLYDRLKRAVNQPQGPSAEEGEIGIIGPDGWAVREQRVLLDWNPVEGAGAQDYELVVFPAELSAAEPVVAPTIVRGKTSFLTPPLPRGRDYAWIVTTVSNGRKVGTFDEIRFRVLSSRELASVRVADANLRYRPIERASIYAVLGLAPEAKDILVGVTGDASTLARAKALGETIDSALMRMSNEGGAK